MLPTAISSGLDVPEDVIHGVPKRPTVTELGLRTTEGKPAQLQAEELYIGHFHHRLQRTKWASPFIVGQHGNVQQCLAKCIDHVRPGGLAEDIHELRSMTLVCDCPPVSPCIGDALALEFCTAAGNLPC